MEILNRISNTFDNIRCTIKNKGSSEKLHVLKRDIQSLITDLVVLGKEDHDLYVRSLAMEGYLSLLSAKTMPISLTEKRNLLQVIFNKLKPIVLREEVLFIFLRIQNLMCYYMIQLDDITQAREILENMEDLYDKVSKSQSSKFLDAEDLFTTEDVKNINRVNPEKIDKVITNNVQMQAFLYNKLNLQDKYRLYNHTALRRQLEMKEGTPQEWALRAARLGNYFTYYNELSNARHHLCAAYHVLRTCHDNCKLIPEEFVLQKADFEMHFLELSHHWVKYGLTLFKISKKKVLSRYFTKPSLTSDLWRTVETLDEHSIHGSEKTDEDNAKDAGTEKVGMGDGGRDNLFIFPSLDLKDMEDRVPLNIVESPGDAQKLFTFTHKWLMRAKHYYDFEQHSSQYIACSLQLAELYEHLAFFERNLDHQYSIQRRRADVLESLNSLLKSCDNVMSVQIDIIRELSQVQLELMALNLQKLWREESQTNIFADNDTDSIIHSLDSESNKTLTEKTLNTSSKNMFLRKMEAATSINGKLFRLSGQLSATTPSQLSLNIGTPIN